MRDAVSLQARSNPDATALVDAETDDAWTYRELDAAVDRTAGRLAALGVESGDRVAVLLETRPAFAALAFACARLGAVLVPLNARLARRELAEQVETARPVLVVCGADTAADAVALGETGSAANSLDVPVVSVDDGDVVRQFESIEPATFDPADVASGDDRALLFTSGTTGSPKAVRLTYGNVAASAVASAFRLGVLPDDRWLCPLSMYHTGGLSVVLRAALYGTTAVLVRTPGFDADEVRDALVDYDCTGVSLVPTMLRDLLDAIARDGDRGGGGGGDRSGGGNGDRSKLPESLRFALVGGAPTPRDLVERALDAGVPVCPTYGTTETASQVATLRPEQAGERPESAGRPLLGTDVTVIGDDGEPLPTEEVGEIAVSGPTVTPGYVGGNSSAESDASAESVFCEYGLLTGDRGYLDADGFLYVGGRQTDEIVTGGENVHPAEVADVLREHRGVEDAVVVGVPDDQWGERVGALVAPAETVATAGGEGAGDEVTADDLRSFCEGRLAGYKHPRAVAFVDELPRTPSGTVDREAAAAVLADET